MPELIRTFAVRNPVPLSPHELSNAGIPTHPPKYQSAEFRRWLSLCENGTREALEHEFVAYLQGRLAVRGADDLGPAWADVLRAFQAHGTALNLTDAHVILGGKTSASLFGPDEKELFAVRTRVADTVLALAFLRNLGHRANVDYQHMLRTITFVERALAPVLRPVSEGEFRRHFGRPILLPPCFFPFPSCPKKPAGAFPFLSGGGAASNPPQSAPSKGCSVGRDCTCEPNKECVDQRLCCATVTPYVVDLHLVRDSTHRYAAGDLSFIKNVLAGETLSTRHRRLVRTEEVTESETETTSSSERDLQVNDESSLQKELSETLSSDQSFDAGVTATTSWGVKGTYSLTTNANYSYDQSKEDARKETLEYVRDVVDRTVAKLEQKARASTRITRLIETEEINRHGFRNESGPNVNGQYLYVNKISRAQVYNYGKKGAIDLYLPEPAANFLRLLEGKFEGVKPSPPAPFNITPSSITRDNYMALATQYALTDIPAPPLAENTIPVRAEAEPGDPSGGKKSGSRFFYFSCSIPANYAGDRLSATSCATFWNKGGGETGQVSISLDPVPDALSLAESVIHGEYGLLPTPSSVALPNIEGARQITAHTWDVTSVNWMLSIHCRITPAAELAWQLSVFTKLREAYGKLTEIYEKALAKYLEDKKAFEDKQAALKWERCNRNPFLNRETERTELKRMAISYLTCQFFDRFDAMKHRVRPCGYPQMDIAEAEEEGRFIQFCEQAFNWSLITYIFYPYFWGRKCAWADKMKEESNDLIFQQFLSAGSSHVLIPIRDGFFDLVQYFLATGEIWGSNGTPPTPADPHYLSMAQEIKEQKGNFYADREGTLDVTHDSAGVVLSGTDWYWKYGDPLGTPQAGVDGLRLQADRDREIVIDCVVYRIADIQENTAVPDHTSWTITLERNYEGQTASGLKWSTGAVFVGAPWEFATPTDLVFLRDQSHCLPSYPLPECE